MDNRSISKTPIQSFHDLPVYQEAVRLQQAIFRATQKWPKEEKYSLIDQIRRSSRSVGANLAESWAKRRYKAHFVSKLTDADAELQETRHWLDTAVRCEYLIGNEAVDLMQKVRSIGRQLGAIMARADEFCM